MKKKWTLLFLAALFAVPLVFGGCKDGGGDSSGSLGGVETMPSEEEKPLTLDKTAVTALTIGDSIVINADYTYKTGVQLTWKSSDENIVTVDGLDSMNCSVTAVNLGTATVTATYEDLVASCTVTTATNGIYPVLTFENEVETEGGLNKLPSDKIDLGAYVNFNGKRYDDMQVTYSIADPSFGTIDQATGVVTLSDKLGSTTITAAATWRGIPSELLTKTVEINVIIPSVYEVTNGEGAMSVIDLYTVTEFEGSPLKKEETLSVSIKENNVAIADYTVEIVDHVAGDGTDKEVAVWDETSNTVVAQTYGTANLKISHVSAVSGKTVTRYYPITVNCPQGEYETVEYFSTMKGSLPVEDIFSVGEKKIIRATQDGRELTVNADGTALTDVVSTALTEMSEETVVVYNDLVSYVVPLETYKMVIEDTTDYLSIFHTTAEKYTDGNGQEKIRYSDTVEAGYYLLKNDITVAQWDKRADGKTDRRHQNLSFNGTFDGNGKTLTTQPLLGGTFGSLKGTVKNLNLVYDVVMDIGGRESGKARGMLAQEGSGATIENVNVRVLGEAGVIDQSVSMLGAAEGYASIKNVVVDYGDAISAELAAFVENSYWGLLFHYGKNTNTENVYVISSTMQYLTVYPDSRYYYYTVAENDTAVTYPDLTQNVQSGAKRYDSWQALAQEKNDLTAFSSDLWDTTGGIPVWKTIAEEYVLGCMNDVVSEEVVLESVNPSLIEIELYYGSVELSCELTFKEIATFDIATIDGCTITPVKNAFGTGTVVASYQLNGSTYQKEFPLTVYLGEDTADTTEYKTWTGDNLVWSTNGTDGAQLTVPADLSAFGKIERIYNETDGVTVFLNDTWTTEKNTLDNTTNELVTKDIRIQLTDGTGYRAKLDCVAKLIKTQDDLNSVLLSDTTIEGYYALANDITVTDWSNTNSKGKLRTNHYNMEFNGVFDGNGKTLTCVPVTDGIFGYLGGTVKNLYVVFNATTDHTDSTLGSRNALIAMCGEGGSIENLNITLNGTDELLKNVVSLFGRKNYATIKNVVADLGAVLSATPNGSGYGLLFSDDVEVSTLENVYLISSTLKSVAKYATSGTTVYASNDTSLGETLSGVYRYDSWDKFGTNDLSGFDSKYWDTTSGLPLWHAIAEDFFTTKWKGDNLVWSTNETQLIIPETMGALANVKEIYNETDGVTVYADGAWTADTLANTTNALVSKDIRVRFTDGTTYLATLDCVTQTISDATELETVLPKSGSTKGYYVLDTDVTVSAWTVDNHKNFTFYGTLDGRGHKLTVPQIIGGLFGYLSGTVKNVDIQISSLLESGVYTYDIDTGSIISKNIYKTANVENVNIKLNGSTKNSVTFSMFGYMNYDTTNLYLTNVVIDCGDFVSANLDALTNSGDSGLLLHYGHTSKNKRLVASNVYIISSGLKYLMVNNDASSPYYAVAENDTNLTHDTIETKYTISGVYCYDSWTTEGVDVKAILTALDSDYWEVAEDKLVWKTK